MKKYGLWLALCLGSVLLASCASSKEALAAPSSLKVTAGVNKVDLTWEDNSDNEAGFAVYRKLETESSFVKLEQTAPVNAENYTDTKVNSSGRYVYQVRAFATDGSESAPADIGEAVAITVLATPSDLTATSGEGKIDLTWTDTSDNEEGFRIFRKLESDTDFPTEALATVAADVANYSDTTVSADSSYVYQVIAFAGSSVSEASNSSTPTMPTTPNPNPNPTPEAPVISSLTAPENDTTYAVGTQIQLSWSIAKQTTLTELKLERVDTGQILTSDEAATKATVTLPNEARTVTYKLTATNADGTSTKEIQISTGERPDIENLEPSSSAEGFYGLSWTMKGTGPFTFKAYFEVESQTSIEPKNITIDVKATLNGNGIYTATFQRPDGEILKPPVLVAFSEFGSAPGEQAESEIETF
jgi:hypothetical protein